MDSVNFSRQRLAKAVAGGGIVLAGIAAAVTAYTIWFADWGHIGTRHWKLGLISILTVPAFIFFGSAWLAWSWAAAIDPSRPPFIDPKRRSN